MSTETGENFGSGPLSGRFDEALAFASELHREQSRKIGRVPYLSHLLRVAGLALDFGASEDVAIAALLHDAVEDCGGMATEAVIRERFGDFVADVVLETSDSTTADANRKAPWRERKEAYLAHLRTGSEAAALVSGCDKLDNITSLTRAMEIAGNEATLSRFKGGSADLIWYYESVAEVLNERGVLVAGELSAAIERWKENLQRRKE
ncbi:MAG: HD domain-containing protein [Thermoguttaceae bacterium]|nr:HD domain-containing protein [Thermoguttaceae bacterium]MBQ8363645.1 HD domain-containing protein [Thermoguttaceae bacterium]MBQ9126310.1 HD domain-containing protein [Thermoguttaceae bacterium]